MYYDIICNNCNYKKTVNITLAEYEEMLKNPCPKCNRIGLLQDFSKRKKFAFELKGYGWTRKTKIREGSKDDLDDALRENDYLQDKANKYDHIDNDVADGYNKKHGNKFKGKK